MIPNSNAQAYVNEALDLKYQNESGKPGKIKADPSKSLFLDSSKSGVSLGFNVNTVA